MKSDPRGEQPAPVLDLQNRQRTKSLNLPMLRQLATRVIEQELLVSNYELGFHFVEAKEMAEVNEQFLQHTGSTDVITFDHGAGASGRMHGEIFISIPDAVRQAREFNTTWQAEVARYVIHGLLHLRGYDDLNPTARRVMKKEENRLLKTVAQATNLSAIERQPRKSVGTRT